MQPKLAVSLAVLSLADLLFFDDAGMADTQKTGAAPKQPDRITCVDVFWTT